ncbi:MAG: efflux RND transporter periplasmic adaptor subunit [Acidobacteriota bacterium]
MPCQWYRVFYFVAIASLVALTGCGGDRPAEAGRSAEAKPGDAARQPDPIAVRTAPVDTRTMVSIHRASTTLRAARQAPVVARAAGIVREIRVEEGTYVAPGQVLAVLEDDEARLNAEKARVDLDVSEREFARADQLLNDHLLSAQEHGQKQAALAQAKAARERSDLALTWTKITAPFGGVVTKRMLDRGATVSSMQPVFELADVSRLYADVPIPEAVAAKLVAGGKTTLKPVASNEVEAVIERLSPAVDATTGTVKVTVVTAATKGLKPGAFVEVEVVTDTHANVTTVPREALIADGSRWRVFTIEQGKAKAVGVVTGFESDGRVEVGTEPGAAAIVNGMEVVTSGAAALTDGAPVRVIVDKS